MFETEKSYEETSPAGLAPGVAAAVDTLYLAAYGKPDIVADAFIQQAAKLEEWIDDAMLMETVNRWTAEADC